MVSYVGVTRKVGHTEIGVIGSIRTETHVASLAALYVAKSVVTAREKFLVRPLVCC